jgi:hypothetical protein
MEQSALQTLRSASVTALPSAAALPGAAIESLTAPRASIRAVGPAALPLRIGLIVACAVAVGAAYDVGNPTAYLQADLALAHLLRGMAVIKSMIVLAAVGAVWWRLGWAVSRPVAVAYVAGCAALAGSTMLIWQLTSIPLAAVVFHGAALGMVIVGWRER